MVISGVSSFFLSVSFFVFVVFNGNHIVVFAVVVVVVLVLCVGLFCWCFVLIC